MTALDEAAKVPLMIIAWSDGQIAEFKRFVKTLKGLDVEQCKASPEFQFGFTKTMVSQSRKAKLKFVV